jgi:hypothetical protein
MAYKEDIIPKVTYLLICIREVICSASSAGED